MTVVDASVWVSLLVPSDVHHTASHQWFQHYLARDDLLFAPVLLLAEVSAAVCRRTGDPDLARRSTDYLLRVPALRLVPVDQRLGELAADLAAELRLRGADAVYVAAAHYLNVPLVTWDTEQRERAGKAIVVQTPTSFAK